jgi:glycine cleavage system H protein
MQFPENLRYTREHEWILVRDHEATVGITDFAQHELGDVVFVELPEVGVPVSEGKAFGVVESVKAVSDVYAPVDGTVTAVNDDVRAKPELVNQDPYGGGWLVKIRLADPGQVDLLMTAAAYSEYTRGQET